MESVDELKEVRALKRKLVEQREEVDEQRKKMEEELEEKRKKMDEDQAEVGEKMELLDKIIEKSHELEEKENQLDIRETIILCDLL